MSGAQPKAGNISGCITICAEVNIKAIKTRHSQNWIDEVISDTHELTKRVNSVFDFTPKSIAKELDLLRPIYSSTAAGGHFGRTPGIDGEFPWEILRQDKLDSLQN